MNQNEPFTGVKPQSHQIGRVLGLIEFLAATSCIISDMVQTATTLWTGPFKWDFQKSLIKPCFERLGIVFMKTYEGERSMNAKKINMEMITWLFFWACALECLRMYSMYAWVCEVRVLGISIMVGAWPLWLLQTTEVQYSHPHRIQCEPSLQLPMSKHTATLTVVQANA